MPARDEFDLIDWIRQRSQLLPPVQVGIGDDAAVLAGPGSGERLLVTTDMLIEGRHFTFDTATAPQMGRKALAVNLSDIAAMGGRPTAAFISLALPTRHGRRIAEELYAGLEALAAEHGVAIAGGDTNAWDGPLVINVTLLGETTRGRAVLRSGARPGDQIFVTGPLGGSLPSGRHLTFEPRVREAQRLHALLNLHAMMDISDGLASDIAHIAKESEVGVVLHADRIPVHSDVDGSVSDMARLRHALSDGEDFELLLTVDPDDAARIRASGEFSSLIRIGEVRQEPGCFLSTEEGLRPLEASGWVHHFE